jgi:hypothetical protein
VMPTCFKILSCVLVLGLLGCSKDPPTSPSTGPNPGLAVRLQLTHLPVVGDTATALCRIIVNRTAFYLAPEPDVGPWLPDTVKLAHVWLLAYPQFQIESQAEFQRAVKLGDTLEFAVRIRAVSASPQGGYSDLSLRATFADSAFVGSDGFRLETWGHSLILILGGTTMLFAEIGPY